MGGVGACLLMRITVQVRHRLRGGPGCSCCSCTVTGVSVTAFLFFFHPSSARGIFAPVRPAAQEIHELSDGNQPGGVITGRIAAGYPSLSPPYSYQYLDAPARRLHNAMAARTQAPPAPKPHRARQRNEPILLPAMGQLRNTRHAPRARLNFRQSNGTSQCNSPDGRPQNRDAALDEPERLILGLWPPPLKPKTQAALHGATMLLPRGPRVKHACKD